MKSYTTIDWADWGIPFGFDYYENLPTRLGPHDVLVLKIGPIHLLISWHTQPRRTS